MAFKDLKEYTITDIQSLITNGVEESIHLDFKASGALSGQDSKRKEIAKDVSSFANSDGGVIVYGIEELDHKASSLSYIDGERYNKEWLENVISSNIQQRIDGVEIIPIRDNGDISKTIYVVKIPRSYNSPHMCSDNRYYKRFNFKSVPMEEYEMRDLFYRKENSKLVIAEKFVTRKSIDSRVRYTFCSVVYNCSKSIDTQYRLTWYINYNVDKIKVVRGLDTEYVMRLAQNKLKVITPGIHDIFPKENIEMQEFQISINKRDQRSFEQDTKIEMILFYMGGEHKIETTLTELLK